MNILLLAETYPPEPVVGAFRAQKVASAFAQRGHRVRVLTTGAGGATHVVHPAIELSVVRPWRGQRTVQRALGWLAGENRSGFRRTLADLAGVPDDLLGFVPAAWFVGRNIRGMDLIYSTSPSHSMHLAAMALRRKWRIPWIAEFRDPWTDNAMLEDQPGAPLAARINGWLERRVLDAATGVVAVTERAGELFRSKLGPKGSRRVLVALNGIDGVRSASHRPPRNRLRIVYAGSLYRPRSPLPILEAAAALQLLPGTPAFEFVFVGDCRHYDGEDLAARCEKLGLGASVVFHNWLPRQEAQDLVTGADLLLLPAQRWVLQIPNKLFDYLGARVPILALCERNSETAQLLTRSGGHFLAFTDVPAEISGVLAAALKSVFRSSQPVGEVRYLETLRTEAQMERLMNGVASLLSDAGTDHYPSNGVAVATAPAEPARPHS